MEGGSDAEAEVVVPFRETIHFVRFTENGSVDVPFHIEDPPVSADVPGEWARPRGARIISDAPLQVGDRYVVWGRTCYDQAIPRR